MNSPERKNKLLTDLKEKKLTMNQFLIECALWSLEPPCFAEIIVKQYPVPPPEWQEYADLNPKDKREMKPEFFHQLPIKLYLQSRSRILSWNKGQYDRLKEIKAVLPDTQENFNHHQRIDAKLREFERWLKLFYPKPGPVLYEDQDQERKVVEPVGVIMEGILSTFNGGIV